MILSVSSVSSVLSFQYQKVTFFELSCTDLYTFPLPITLTKKNTGYTRYTHYTGYTDPVYPSFSIQLIQRKMTGMKKTKSLARKNQNKNVPLPIEEDGSQKDFVVGQQIITERQEITHTSGKEQGKKPARVPPKEYQFKPGQSGNPGGRTPDLVKGIALRLGQLKAGKVLSESELDKLKRLGLDTADITVVESIIIDWMTSRNPVKQQLYIERIAGKVPNININAEISAAIVSKFRNKFTDAELERIGAGEEALEILLDKLPDVPDVIHIESEDEDMIDASE